MDLSETKRLPFSYHIVAFALLLSKFLITQFLQEALTKIRLNA